MKKKQQLFHLHRIKKSNLHFSLTLDTLLRVTSERYPFLRLAPGSTLQVCSVAESLVSRGRFDGLEV